MNMIDCRVAVLAVCLLPQTVASASEPARKAWAGFRNAGDSLAAGAFPVEWSPESGIAWQKELVGYGQSTPVIFQGKVYVTSVVGPQKEAVRVACLDLKTGAEVWAEQFDAATKGKSNYMNSRAAPTPVVDANGVYAFFESGDLVAFSPAGKRRWHQNLAKTFGPFQNNHGLGSSPAQSEELIFLNLEHRGPSRLLAIEKSTGTIRWQAERPSGNSWTSPIVISTPKAASVVVSSAGSVTAYDVATGKPQWVVDGLEGNSVPSPTFDGIHLIVGSRLPEFGSTAAAAKSNLCLKQGDDGRFEPHWRAEKVVSDYASPVIAADCAYFLNKSGVLFCVDVRTGETHYTKRLGVSCWSTPLVAAGHVYFFGKRGETVVILAGSEFKKVAVNSLWESAHPPAPETYVEYQSPDGHGNGEAAAGGRRGGMLAMLMKGDSNKDGILTKAEVPEPFRAMFPRVDLNQDGSLDAAELKTMEERFKKRRAGSRESARDPIVYGFAAAEGTIVIRTGTRVYAVTQAPKATP